MSIETSLPGWQRHAIVPLALSGGLALAMLPGAPGVLLGSALLLTSSTMLLRDRLRHHVAMQARFCEQWPDVVAPLAREHPPAPAAPAPTSVDTSEFDRRRRGVATKAAALRLALAGGEEPAELELQLRDLMDRLSLHVRRETDLLARRADARRRADVDAARLQLANAEYDFHRYCIGELALPELVDRVTTTMIAGQVPPASRLTGHDQAPSRRGEIDA
ncbi:MAG: hypothetical protein JF585_05175 [Burkholderiales bacterium]|jgi:hypothetical protein|nr:hypothetical protein [Burkholderiales bacterium]